MYIEGLTEMHPEVVQAHNTATPGLILVREADRTGDFWRVAHAPSGYIVHRPDMRFPMTTAQVLALMLGKLTDWLRDDIAEDDALGIDTLIFAKLAFMGHMDHLTG